MDTQTLLLPSVLRERQTSDDRPNAPLRLGLKWLVSALMCFGWAAVAQPGPPEGVPPGPPAWVPGPPSWAAPPARERALEVGERLLQELSVTTLIERGREGHPGERELVALLGIGDQVFGYVKLHPIRLEPAPLGVDLGAVAPRRGLQVDHVLPRLNALLPSFALSQAVVADTGGYRVLLVYQGRVVGVLFLTEAFELAPQPAWLDGDRPYP